MSDTERVQEALCGRLAELEDEVASDVVVHPGKRFQQVKFSTSHLNSSHDDSTISFTDVVLIVLDNGIDQGKPEGCKIPFGLFGDIVVIFFIFEGLGPNEHHVRKETLVSILGKHGLGNIPLVLLIEALSMLDSSQGPFVNVQLKILKDPDRLAALPFSEV